VESQPPFKFSEHSSGWDEDDDSDTSSTQKARPVSPQPGHKDESLPTRPGFFIENAKKDDKKEAELLFRSAGHPEHTAQAEKESQSGAKTNEAERGRLENEPETLTPEEVTLVMQEYVDDRSEVVDAELEQSRHDSPTAAAAFADKRFLEHFEERLANQFNEAVDAILEGALHDTAQELGLSESETEAGAESTKDAETGAPENTEKPPSNIDMLAPASEATLNPAENNIDNDDGLSSSAPRPAHSASTSTPTASAPPASSKTAPAAPASTSHPAAGTSSGGSVPPNGNNMGGTGAGGNFMGVNFSSSRTPDAMATPGANTPGRAETIPSPNRSGHDFAKGAMLGGTVGYLIGRHRGRVKTERKFIPVTEKLQKEVAKLQDKVVQKEQQVRKMTAQKVIAEQPAKVTAPETTKQPAANSEVLAPVAVQQPEQTFASTQPKQQGQERNRRQEAQPDVKETPARQQPTKPEHTASAESQPHAPGAIERMPKMQLLEAAAEVVVAGSTLKKMYEAGVLNETSLRKVMVEYARGGNTQAEHQLHTELAATQKEQLTNRETDASLNSDKRRDTRESKSNQPQNETGTWVRGVLVTAEHPHGWQVQVAINEHARQKVATAPPKRAGRAGPLAGVAAILVAALVVWLFITH